MESVVNTPPLPPSVEGNLIFSKNLPASWDLKGFLEKHADDKGGLFYVWMRTVGLAVLTEPEYVQYVLLHNQRNYIKSFGYEILGLFLGQGLLTSDGDF